MPNLSQNNSLNSRGPSANSNSKTKSSTKKPQKMDPNGTLGGQADDLDMSQLFGVSANFVTTMHFAKYKLGNPVLYMIKVCVARRSDAAGNPSLGIVCEWTIKKRYYFLVLANRIQS